MSLFAWKQEYAVGHPDIDEQHKQLFRMADDLHQAMMEGRGREALIGLYSRLVTYTRHHFAAEERLMRESAYPGYVQHHLQHEKLTEQVLTLQKNMASKQTTVTLETMNFLSDWLMHHIGGSDQKVAAHIAARQKNRTAAVLR